jgi:hypothetical protein
LSFSELIPFSKIKSQDLCGSVQGQLIKSGGISSSRQIECSLRPSSLNFSICMLLSPMSFVLT